jgi:hypothetical protein
MVVIQQQMGELDVFGFWMQRNWWQPHQLLYNAHPQPLGLASNFRSLSNSNGKRANMWNLPILQEQKVSCFMQMFVKHVSQHIHLLFTHIRRKATASHSSRDVVLM